MNRLALTAVVGLTVLLLVAPADAFQCPKLVKQLQDATATRFDAAATEAKLDAAQAQTLHTDGNHAESEKVAKAALDEARHQVLRGRQATQRPAGRGPAGRWCVSGG